MRGANTLCRATGNDLEKKVGQIFAAGHEDDAKLAPIDDRCDHEACGSACPGTCSSWGKVEYIGEPNRALVVAVEDRWRMRMGIAKVGEDAALFDGRRRCAVAYCILERRIFRLHDEARTQQQAF
jgi:hypothetical protein